MGEIRKIIGENIKKICTLKNVRQVEIAEHMGVSQGSVSNWIKGTNSIDIENLAELCAFLGVSLDQIYGVAPMTPEVTLSQQETELLSSFRALNDSARQAALTVVTSLAQVPANIRPSDSDEEKDTSLSVG